MKYQTQIFWVNDRRSYLLFGKLKTTISIMSFAFLMFLFSSNTYATNYTLQGTWSNPANWTPSYPGTTIGAGDVVLMNGDVTGVSNSRSTIDVNVTIATGSFFSVNYLKGLTINAGVTLTVNGKYINGTGVSTELYGTFIANNPNNGVDEIIFSNGSTLNIYSGGGLIQTGAGAFNFAGQLNNSGTIDIAAGSIFNNQAGSGQHLANSGIVKGGGVITNYVINLAGGTVAPGTSPGCMSIGQFINSAGTLEIEVDGSTACTDYDKVTVTTFNLNLTGGILDISVNYIPTLGDVITFLDGTSITGTFASNNVPAGWTLKYNFPNAGEVSIENTSAVNIAVDLNAAAVCANATSWSVPIKMDANATLGAVSFVLDYDQSVLTYTGFSSTNTAIQNDAVVNNDGDKLSFVWTAGSSAGLAYTANATLLELNFTPNTSGAAASPVFTWSTVSGDCELADNNAMVIAATFNDVTGTINATPTIGLTGNNTICADDNVTFTATGGTSYEFFVGTTSQGAASATATFSTTALTNGQIVTVVGTDANSCSVTSAGITMVVNALPTPTLSSSDADDEICVGESVTYTASGANEYIFKIGTTVVQAQSATATYTTTTLSNNDVVSVIGVNTTTGCQGTSATTFTMSVINCYEYSGNIVYKNTAETYMGNVALTLTKTGGTAYNTTTSLVDGTFSFTNIPGGTYSLSYSTGKTHGGANGTDAFRVILHAISFAPLTGLNKKAGDVNGNSTTLADDALLIARRFVGLDNSFAAGDWTFEDANFTLSGDLTNQKIYGLAYGDVNGSYTPNSTENTQPTVFLVNGDNIEIADGQNVTIPVRMEKGAVIGAASLAISYQGMTINNVTLANGQNVIYNAVNNELRISWADLATLNLGNDAILFNIEATIDDAAMVVNNPMMLNNDSEIANEIADAYSFIELKLPTFTTLSTNTNDVANAALGVRHYPNPFIGMATIAYNLPTTSDVSIIITNALGQQVRTLVNATQMAGEQKIQFHADNLPAGVYNYTITVIDGENQYRITNQLILIK